MDPTPPTPTPASGPSWRGCLLTGLLVGLVLLLIGISVCGQM